MPAVNAELMFEAIATPRRISTPGRVLVAARHLEESDAHAESRHDLVSDQRKTKWSHGESNIGNESPPDGAQTSENSLDSRGSDDSAEEPEPAESGRNGPKEE
jgi:hypothetical protein